MPSLATESCELRMKSDANGGSSGTRRCPPGWPVRPAVTPENLMPAEAAAVSHTVSRPPSSSSCGRRAHGSLSSVRGRRSATAQVAAPPYHRPQQRSWAPGARAPDRRRPCAETRQQPDALRTRASAARHAQLCCELCSKVMPWCTVVASGGPVQATTGRHQPSRTGRACSRSVVGGCAASESAQRSV